MDFGVLSEVCLYVQLTIRLVQFGFGISSLVGPKVGLIFAKNQDEIILWMLGWQRLGIILATSFFSETTGSLFILR